jgi:hypothetical protein
MRTHSHSPGQIYNELQTTDLVANRISALTGQISGAIDLPRVACWGRSMRTSRVSPWIFDEMKLGLDSALD